MLHSTPPEACAPWLGNIGPDKEKVVTRKSGAAGRKLRSLEPA
jgi:hypothetical protein